MVEFRLRRDVMKTVAGSRHRFVMMGAVSFGFFLMPSHFVEA